MEYTFYECAMLFFTWSFLAWLAETAVAVIREKDFRNRGFASGPFCFIYGLTGVLFLVFLDELKDDLIFLFLGSMAVATAVEWMTGKLLERMDRQKWWDYSAKKWNFDGYICLQYSLLWGLMGVLTVRYGNAWMVNIYRVLPQSAGRAVVWILLAAGLADVCGSLVCVCHLEEKLPALLKWNRRLYEWTLRLSVKVSGHIERRIRRSYPVTLRAAGESGADGETCSPGQLFWLFLAGAFLGDIMETVFCRITAGVWMSRSSLVWGPFSIVWGLAIALVTALLYKDRNKQEHHIFWVGPFLGGAYEYMCSVFTELVFRTVFWDYSALPFNLGGRINLLYCFFWGIAAVIWMKGLYPRVARFTGNIRKKTGRWLTVALAVFLALDMAVSVMALVRYDSRAEGRKAVYRWEQVMDRRFGDARMERIYPNAIRQQASDTE